MQCATYVRMFLFCAVIADKIGKILKNLLYPKMPYPLHEELLAELYRACLQGSAESLLISPNY